MPTHTVLVIDDEEAIRDAVRMTLEDGGYTVLVATNGAAGLDLLRASDQPLVVLLDRMMPKLSGIAVLHTVAEEPEVANRHAYIIFSAARAFSPTTLNFYLPGKRLFDLPKPFDLDHLVAIVEQARQQLDRAQDGADTDKDATAAGEPVHVEAPSVGGGTDGSQSGE